MKFQRRKFELGFVSVEVIFVVAVVLGLLALGASKTGILSGGADATEELSNIQALYSATKELKTASGYGSNGANLVSQLSATDSFPKNIAFVSSVPKNVFGGTITINSTGSGFTIGEDTLPQKACVQLATKISRGGTFSTVSINGSAYSGEVTSAQASSACVSGSTNSVIWTSVS